MDFGWNPPVEIFVLWCIRLSYFEDRITVQIKQSIKHIFIDMKFLYYQLQKCKTFFFANNHTTVLQTKHSHQHCTHHTVRYVLLFYNLWTLCEHSTFWYLHFVDYAQCVSCLFYGERETICLFLHPALGFVMHLDSICCGIEKVTLLCCTFS